jgi:hypothetical protein
VEEISLSGFAAGRPVGVAAGAPPKFAGVEVVQRARSRVGEDSYRLLTNNCEHFCEWCLRGQNRSYQIEAWLTPRSPVRHARWRRVAQRLWLGGQTSLHAFGALLRIPIEVS